ncbi:MAG: helix-turn-helix transcriptional regulator [Gemmatimonadales bacterium]|nr:helix-turn-helix transcriptional regulator [Gemmatimonadales bacterium]
MEKHKDVRASAIRPFDGRRFRVERFGPTLPSCQSVAFGAGLFQLVFIEGGLGSCRIGAETLTAGPGDLFVVSPGQQHDLTGLDDTTNWVISFGVDALGFASRHRDATSLIVDDLFLNAFLNPERLAAANRCAVALEERRRWLARLASLEGELRSQAAGSNAAAHALLELLLIDVVRTIRPLAGSVSPHVSPHSSPILVSVFRFIDRRFRFPIGLADVAKAVARSPSYLTELVRRETGRTVLQWIIERRMAEARRLLLESNTRVKVIGQAIGYDDPGHFIRLFSRLHDLPPQQWRLARRG